MSKRIFDQIEPIYSHVHFQEVCKKLSMTTTDGKLFARADEVAAAYLEGIGYAPLLKRLREMASVVDQLRLGGGCMSALDGLLSYTGMLLSNHFCVALTTSVNYPDVENVKDHSTIAGLVHYPLGTRLLLGMLSNIADIPYAGAYRAAVDELIRLTHYLMPVDAQAAYSILNLDLVAAGPHCEAIRKGAPRNLSPGQYMMQQVHHLIQASLSQPASPGFFFDDYIAHYKRMFTEAHRKALPGKRFGGFVVVAPCEHPLPIEGLTAEEIIFQARERSNDILKRMPIVYKTVTHVLNDARFTRFMDAELIDVESVCEGVAGHDALYALSGMECMESEELDRREVQLSLAGYLMEAAYALSSAQQSKARLIHRIASVIAYTDALFHAFTWNEAVAILNTLDYYSFVDQAQEVQEEIAQGFNLCARKTLINTAVMGLVHNGNLESMRGLFKAYPSLDQDLQDVMDYYEGTRVNVYGMLTGNPTDREDERTSPRLH